PLGFFLHTSFPNRSILSCIPNHRELMRSLTAYDLIGFQTDEDLLRFRDYATAELFATVVGQTDLRFGERRVRLGVFPIGIDAERFAAAAAGAVATRPVQRLRQVLAGSRLVIGVDRLDYSKGLVRRFQAYQQFFALYPEERRRVSFLQITPPTRGKVEAYREMRTELAGIAGEMNAHLGDADWVPLRYINEGFSPEKLAGYYRLAKIGCVTPLRDGMNLVAKEYVACQDPEDPGVLVLSTFAGAARQMGAALLVNPYDPAAVASRLREALYMPLEERLERWSALMRTLKGTDLQAWFRSFIAILETPTVATAPFQARSVA
ncbi:MAG TPA: trehalose-6-phosphate synthase, partial [Stellaceae bacterium]|nr:trehalose-6-phosphate synthase [Stellaceae bacterium]